VLNERKKLEIIYSEQRALREKKKIVRLMDGYTKARK
jgi:hypothetical protein